MKKEMNKMTDILAPIDSLPDVSFIDDTTLDDVLTEMINLYQTKYEEITGRRITLAKADPNRIILNACAIMIYQGYQYIDRAGKQDLLKYSYGEFLDNVAALKGVYRTAAKPAIVTVRFTLSEARSSAVSIPTGTRVSAGNIYFETTEYKEIPAGDTYIDIIMECTTDGTIGNDFVVGEITVLANAIGYVASVSNTTISSGGTESESDISLAERTFLAPSSYSTAGPEDAYIYWAKSYSQKILDVKVISENPCEVDLRFIMEGGVIPDATTIQALSDYLSDTKKRPLTDRLTVAAPDIVSYSIDVVYYINKSDSSRATSIQTAVEAAVLNYTKWQDGKIGRDINPSELIRLMMAAGAKRIVINTPVHTEVTDTSIANVTTKTVTYGGIEND
jgi:phage-related baseplate assembly protein